MSTATASILAQAQPDPTPTPEPTGNDGFDEVVDILPTPDFTIFGDFEGRFERVLVALVTVLVAVTLISILWYGIKYVIQGDPGERARNLGALKNAIIVLIVSLVLAPLALAIASVIRRIW